jgi:ligand-binding SRPBCC domain-containing protein
VPSFVLTNLVAATPEECFRLSLSVDAHTASMSASDERVVAGVTAGVMRSGDTVTWRAKHFGIAFTMTSKICEYDAPYRFVDEQVSGPFRRWWHEHRFEAVASGTLMTDVVEFESPAGPLGRIVNRLILTRYMRRLIRHRNSWLVEALSTPDA